MSPLIPQREVTHEQEGEDIVLVVCWRDITA
jgi:hypothetical protein